MLESDLPHALDHIDVEDAPLDTLMRLTTPLLVDGKVEVQSGECILVLDVQKLPPPPSPWPYGYGESPLSEVGLCDPKIPSIDFFAFGECKYSC